MTDLVTPSTEPGPVPAEACALAGAAVVDREDPDVVPAALQHLAAVARHACRAVASNGHYPPELAVTVLTDTTAALAELAHLIGPYVGDYWHNADQRITTAETSLTEARGQLDAVRHHITLIPADDHLVGVAA